MLADLGLSSAVFRTADDLLPEIAAREQSAIVLRSSGLAA